MVASQQPSEELTYCTVHPDRETSLRCNKCGRLMCAECAVPTPVGYRCKQCVRQHEDKFFSASQNDYITVSVICAGLTGVGAYIASIIGILLILALIAIPIGGFIAEAALRVTKRRRGRHSAEVGAASVVIGGLAGAVIHTYYLLSPIANAPGQRGGGLSLDMVIQFTLQTNIGALVFIGIVTFFVYSRFRMRA